jgi:quinol monooxygenase YgiN
MVIILGKVKLETQQEAERIIEALQRRAEKSRSDAGNVDYAFSLNVEDASEVRLTEIWESETELNAHLADPDPEFSEALATAKIASAEIKAYDGTNERVLMKR